MPACAYWGGRAFPDSDRQAHDVHNAKTTDPVPSPHHNQLLIDPCPTVYIPIRDDSVTNRPELVAVQ